MEETLKIHVSVIVMTKNEEKNISKCLDSVKHFDEVFVVDSSSTDNTVRIAEAKGAKVVNFNWNGKYPKKKQWCLENLPFSNEWVLYLDADEEVTESLSLEIFECLKCSSSTNGYFVGYDYVFLDRKLRHGNQVYKLVMFKHHKGRFPQMDDLDAKNMWEVEGHYQPLVEGEVRVLKNHMIHQDHDSLFHYFERHNKYSDWEVVVNKSDIPMNETQLGFRRQLKNMFRRLPGKWLIAFGHSYILKAGFLDGVAGFHYAMSRAFYYWQVEVKTLEKSK